MRKGLRRCIPKQLADWTLDGAKALSFLRQQVDEQDPAIYTSRFAKAEIIYGVLEGRAHTRMAREGFPYRMRQRVGILNQLVSNYLRQEDYEQVMGEWDNFVDLLESRGKMTVLYVEDEGRFAEVAEIAEFLQSRIFMDVLDSWMYACALVMQAEMIITFDEPFKRVINNLHNPQVDPSWRQLQSDLRGMLATRLLGQPTLPRAPKLPGALPAVW